MLRFTSSLDGRGIAHEKGGIFDTTFSPAIYAKLQIVILFGT
jgi:hypothetical protein